jgi:hypothetical protein
VARHDRVHSQQQARSGALLGERAVTEAGRVLREPMVRPEDSRKLLANRQWERWIRHPSREQKAAQQGQEELDGVDIEVDREVSGEKGRSTQVIVREGRDERGEVFDCRPVRGAHEALGQERESIALEELIPRGDGI